MRNVLAVKDYLNVRAIAPFTRSLRVHFIRDVILENVGFEELHFLYGKTCHALELFRVVLRGVFFFFTCGECFAHSFLVEGRQSIVLKNNFDLG